MGLFLDITLVVLLFSSWFSKPQYPSFVSLMRPRGICHGSGERGSSCGWMAEWMWPKTPVAVE